MRIHTVAAVHLIRIQCRSRMHTALTAVGIVRTHARKEREGEGDRQRGRLGRGEGAKKELLPPLVDREGNISVFTFMYLHGPENGGAKQVRSLNCT